MRKLFSLGDSFGKLFDFPHEVSSREPYITLSGNKVISVTACGDVCELSPERIVLECIRYSIAICGNKLNIAYLDEGSITVTGDIATLTFEHFAT